MSTRPAAVVVPIYRAPRNSIVFVRRASHLRRQPNHIAFPGGIADPCDGDDRRATALRELREELGVAEDRVTIVAQLPPRAAVAAAFTLTPFVGVLGPEVALVPDPDEVGAVFEVPLEAVFARGALYEAETDLGERIVHSPNFDYGAMHVWGATGRILRTFVEMVCDDAGGLRPALEAAGVVLPYPLHALHGG